MNPQKIPVFIICRNLLQPMRKLVRWLEKAGQQNIHIIDNDSSFEPTKEYLKSSPHTVHLLKKNIGHRSPWLSGIVEKVCGDNSYYIVSDGDIVPSEECPVDAIGLFYEILQEHYESILKVGFGLRIDDLPDKFLFKDHVISWEQQFWTRRTKNHEAYEAAIDTTFALYKPTDFSIAKPGSVDIKKDGIRTGFPYVARHDPWYWDIHNLTDEQSFYLLNSGQATHWTQKLKDRIL